MDDLFSKLKESLFNIWLFTTVLFAVFIYIPLVFLINLLTQRILKKQVMEIPRSDDNTSRTMRFLEEKWIGTSNSAQNNRVFTYFLLPAGGAFILFVVVPFLMGIYYSMTDWNGLNTGHQVFVGLDNYETLINDYSFVYSFSRTALYSILNIIVINVVAFSLAILVTQKLKLKNIYRAGFFMPNLIGGLVLGYIFQFIFNKAIVEFGGIFSTSILIDGNTALMGLIIVVTWQYAGYIMMIYIAAIQNIPQDLVEASKIDGASAIQRLKTITLPLVAQAFTVALFLTLVTSFKQFDTVLSLTQGGPATQLPAWLQNAFNLELAPVVQATDFIAIDIYDEAFTKYNMALGQAKAIVFFLFLLIISMIQVSFNKKREVEL